MLSTAVQLARENPVHKFKFGAVISTKRNKIISTGQNSFSRTHPLQARYGKKHIHEDACFVHAELASIIKARGKGHTLWVARVKLTDEIGLAKPCPSCMAVIQNETELKKIVYTINNNEHGVIEVVR